MTYYQVALNDNMHIMGANLKMKALTKRDWELIKLLREDGRLSDAELARELGLSKSAVRWRRMNLQNEGYLKVAAFLRFDKLSYSYAYILLKIKADISRKELLLFEKELVDMESVFTVVELLGNYTLLVGVFSEERELLHREIDSILRGRGYIQDYIVLVGVKTLKSEGVAFLDVLK